jgi:hypothetical protein
MGNPLTSRTKGRTVKDTELARHAQVCHDPACVTCQRMHDAAADALALLQRIQAETDPEPMMMPWPEIDALDQAIAAAEGRSCAVGHFHDPSICLDYPTGCQQCFEGLTHDVCEDRQTGCQKACGRCDEGME